MKSFAVLGIAAFLASSASGIRVFGAESVAAVDLPALSRPNGLYPGNRAPLLPSPFIKLPAGAVKPLGWLRRQLELEAGGFTGHLAEISGFCRPADNAWLSAEGKGHSGWEEVPYWFRGFCHLAYVLGDEKLLREARPWIDALFASQREDGWFGPRQNLGDGNGARRVKLPAGEDIALRLIRSDKPRRP
jgi:hypothetical protein